MKHWKRRDRQYPEQRAAAPAVPLATAKPSVPGWEAGVMETALIVPGSVICIIDSDGDSAEMILSATTKVVVQRLSTGRLEIFFNRGVFDSDNRRDVIKALRIREREKTQRKQAHRYNWKELSSPGLLGGWYYDKIRECFYSNDSPVTRLTLDEVVGLIKLALNPRDFNLEMSKWCQQGICLNREHDQCPYYRFGFKRCAAARRAMEAAAKQPPAPEPNQTTEVVFEDATVSQLGAAADE